MCRGTTRTCRGLLATLVALAVTSASADVLAMSGRTLRRNPPDTLLDFGGGRAESLVPHMKALARHAAQDADLVLVFLSTGAVGNDEGDLGETLWHDEAGVGRDVDKLVAEAGAVLLFETPGTTDDPASARRARLASPTGATTYLYPDPGVKALPEPTPQSALPAGVALLVALASRRRRSPRTPQAP